MRFLTSAGITHTGIDNALVDLLGKPICRVQRPLHSDRDARPRATRTGMEVHQRTRAQNTHVRVGLEVAGGARAHRATQHR